MGGELKASELVRRLTAAIEKHGDRDVLAAYESPNGWFELEDEETVFRGSIRSRQVLLIDLGEAA